MTLTREQTYKLFEWIKESIRIGKIPKSELRIRLVFKPITEDVIRGNGGEWVAIVRGVDDFDHLEIDKEFIIEHEIEHFRLRDFVKIELLAGFYETDPKVGYIWSWEQEHAVLKKTNGTKIDPPEL